MNFWEPCVLLFVGYGLARALDLFGVPSVLLAWVRRLLSLHFSQGLC